MRHAIITLSIFVSSLLHAQEREQVTNSIGTPYSSIKERYSVLKDNKTVKDGSYILLRNDKVMVQGYYAQGQKDSVWEEHGWTGAILSRKWYKAGQSTGVWEFFMPNGEPEWSYDFITRTVSGSRKSTLFQDASISYFQSDANAWVKKPVDKPLIILVGAAEWVSFLNRNLRYPDDAVEKEKQGEVQVSVTVDETGAITNYSIIKKAYPSLDEEALRVVKLYPFEFIPAEKDGKKIKSKFNLPIQFKLERG